MPKMLLLKIIVVIHLLNLFGQAGGNSDLGRYGLWPGLISYDKFGIPTTWRFSSRNDASELI